MVENSYSQFIELVDMLRVQVEPVAESFTTAAMNADKIPREAQLHLVKATRAAMKPMLDAFRALAEPLATADMKLSLLQRQLERE